MFIPEASQIHRLDVSGFFPRDLRTNNSRPQTAPTPPAAAIIVWPRPGPAICSARRAAPLPPRAGLRAVPNAHPPSPLCMRQHRRLLGCRRGRKAQEREPRALPGFQPQTGGRGSLKGHQKPVLINKKPTPGPPPSSAHHRVPVFLPVSTSSRYSQPFPASLCCHYASGLKPASFSKEPEEGSRKP